MGPPVCREVKVGSEFVGLPKRANSDSSRPRRLDFASPPAFGRISSGGAASESSCLACCLRSGTASLTTNRPFETKMKRKLNSEDVPEAITPEVGEATVATDGKPTFASLSLDARILQAITREKFSEPTAVQAATVPLALSGKDILGATRNHATVIYLLTSVQLARKQARARLLRTFSR